MSSRVQKLEVEQIIAGYAPVDSHQLERKRLFTEFVTKSEDPCDRNRYTPGHITASTVVLDSLLNHILLINHTTLKRWIQPGGHVEAGDESLASAAVRELREETGLQAKGSVLRIFDLDIHPVPAKGSEPPHQHFDIRFLLISEKQAVTGEHSPADAMWFPVEMQTEAPDLRRLLDRCLNFRSCQNS